MLLSIRLEDKTLRPVQNKSYRDKSQIRVLIILAQFSKSISIIIIYINRLLLELFLNRV